MVKCYMKTASIAIQFATLEMFVGLRSEITNILVTKSVVYVKLLCIEQLLKEYPLSVPL